MEHKKISHGSSGWPWQLMAALEENGCAAGILARNDDKVASGLGRAGGSGWWRCFQWVALIAAQIVLLAASTLCQQQCNLFNFTLFPALHPSNFFTLQSNLNWQQLPSHIPATAYPHPTTPPLVLISFEFMLNCQFRSACYPAGLSVVLAVFAGTKWSRLASPSLRIIISNDCAYNQL